MALGLRDEEEYSLGGLNNLSNLDDSNLSLGNLKGLENIGNNNLSGWGSGMKNDPLATSWDNFKIMFGGGLQTLDDILNKDSFLS